jgi:hypothetical protein
MVSYHHLAVAFKREFGGLFRLAKLATTHAISHTAVVISLSISLSLSLSLSLSISLSPFLWEKKERVR